MQATIKFEEAIYHYVLDLNSTLAALKERITADTNIVPEEQMLFEDRTQLDLPDETRLKIVSSDHRVRRSSVQQDSINNACVSQVLFHLLTPNSAA